MIETTNETERRETVNGLKIVRRTWKNGRPWIQIYNANRKQGARFFPKPILNLTFQTWERAEELIREKLAARAAHKDAMKKRAEERQNYRHDYKVGDILYTSWGYDQTNIEFFQVVAVPSLKSITIREIAGQQTDTPTGNDMAAYVIPRPGVFSFPGGAKDVTKRVSPNGSVKFASYRYAWKWDGRERYCSWYA